ncbi:MAG: hypothetical protein LBQ66_07760 [Planctomycetaceae bacterium]|nr:hypothetical protein [Planctomycetaceae bacterium]
MVNRSFFPLPFGFCPVRARVIWGDFHRALPCAMGFLPRWGVNSPQRKTANTVCRIANKVSKVGRISRIGKA